GGAIGDLDEVVLGTGCTHVHELRSAPLLARRHVADHHEVGLQPVNRWTGSGCRRRLRLPSRLLAISHYRLRGEHIQPVVVYADELVSQALTGQSEGGETTPPSPS